MGVTFNLVDQGITRNSVYGHIVDVLGPRKSLEIDDGVNGHWSVGYRLVVHQNQTLRNSDNYSWDNQLPVRYINNFVWTAANLSTYPTLVVLYADVKSKLASLRVDNAAIASSIADAV